MLSLILKTIKSISKEKYKADKQSIAISPKQQNTVKKKTTKISEVAKQSSPEQAIRSVSTTSRNTDVLLDILATDTLEPTPKSNMSPSEERKFKLKAEKSKSSLVDYVKDISKSQEKMAKILKDHFKTAQDTSIDVAKKSSSFIKDTSILTANKIKEQDPSTIVAGIMLLLAPLMSIYEDIKKEGGIVNYVSNMISSWWENTDVMGLLFKGFKGFSSFVWEAIKFGLKTYVGTVDIIGEALFNDDWHEVRLFWKTHWVVLKSNIEEISNFFEYTYKDLVSWWDFFSADPMQYFTDIILEAFNSSKDIINEILFQVEKWWDSHIKKMILPHWFPYGDELKKALIGEEAIRKPKSVIVHSEGYTTLKEEYELRKRKNEQEYEEKNIKIKKEESVKLIDLYNKEYDRKNAIKIKGKDKAVRAKGKEKWMNVITSSYGNKEGIRKGESHSGVDFRAKIGTPITSITDGEVTSIQNDTKLGGGGNIVVVTDKNNKRILYMHLKESKVKVGDKVSKGDIIALSGNSGRSKTGKEYKPHIHVSIKEGRKSIDPLSYLQKIEFGKKDTTDKSVQIALINKAKIKAKEIKKEKKESINLEGLAIELAAMQEQIKKANTIEVNTLLLDTEKGV